MELFSKDNRDGPGWSAEGRWAILADEEVYEPGLTRIVTIEGDRASDNRGASGAVATSGTAVLVDFAHPATAESPATFERLVLRAARSDDFIEGSRYWEDDPLPDGDLNRLWEEYYESGSDELAIALPSALEVVFIRQAGLACARDPFEDLGEWGQRGSAIV